MKYNRIIVAFLLAVGVTGFSQEEQEETTGSNIQTYTPSKLLNKGQWDIKFFNGLYTEVKSADTNGNSSSKKRENYFTATLEAFTGVSDNNRVNIGAIIEYRSNTIGGRQALSVFSLKDSKGSERKGITSIAPAVKFQPFKKISNFSIQSSLDIPLLENESDDALFDYNNNGYPQGVFLDQTAWRFQNRLFYDYTFSSNKWQLFTELNTEYNFGDEDSFADKTFIIAPSVFMSYFPTNKSTVLGFVQHSQRVGDFEQDYTALGFGGKYQLTELLNLEVLYSKFVRGNVTGLGQSFNIGLRALF